MDSNIPLQHTFITEMVCLQIKVVFDGVKLYLLIEKTQRKQNVRISVHMCRKESFTNMSVLQNSFSGVES